MTDSDAEDLVTHSVEHGSGPDRHFGEEGARLTYGSYLRIDNLLDQQHLESDPPAHDELLFITVHRSTTCGSSSSSTRSPPPGTR